MEYCSSFASSLTLGLIRGTCSTCCTVCTRQLQPLLTVYLSVSCESVLSVLEVCFSRGHFSVPLGLILSCAHEWAFTTTSLLLLWYCRDWSLACTTTETYDWSIHATCSVLHRFWTYIWWYLHLLPYYCAELTIQLFLYCLVGSECFYVLVLSFMD